MLTVCFLSVEGRKGGKGGREEKGGKGWMEGRGEGEGREGRE